MEYDISRRSFFHRAPTVWGLSELHMRLPTDKGYSGKEPVIQVLITCNEFNNTIDKWKWMAISSSKYCNPSMVFEYTMSVMFIELCMEMEIKLSQK